MSIISHEYDSIMKGIWSYTYRYAMMQVRTVDHGLQCRVADTQFTRNAEVPVTVQSLFYHGLIQFHRSSITVVCIKHIFQHLFVLLDKTATAVIAQNAKKNFLIIGQVSHTLYQVDVGMLRSLT